MRDPPPLHHLQIVHGYIVFQLLPWWDYYLPIAVLLASVSAQSEAGRVHLLLPAPFLQDQFLQQASGHLQNLIHSRKYHPSQHILNGNHHCQNLMNNH
jgi:hypothetical protein